ncbi:hypothetical protein [Bradyrhizobium sp. AZCC 1693]|uniref:hypothetical protein n=1 Tax=Bradyrhizobium sp. AZCC 1693 TaxID=3117029 RepID=UPI002FF344FE
MKKRDDRQLCLLLEEFGENDMHVARLEEELKGFTPPVKHKAKAARVTAPAATKRLPVELVPWPAHMRFD